MGEDGEYPAVFSAAMRQARKRHACSECGREIEPGSTYEHVSGLWGDEWSTFRTCEACVQFRPYVEAEAGEPIGHGELLVMAKEW